jgi:hypothetical protein
MIEWHVDLVMPWWIVPLYIACIFLMVAGIYGLFALIDRWWHR